LVRKRSPRVTALSATFLRRAPPFFFFLCDFSRVPFPSSASADQYPSLFFLIHSRELCLFSLAVFAFTFSRPSDTDPIHAALVGSPFLFPGFHRVSTRCSSFCDSCGFFPPLGQLSPLRDVFLCLALLCLVRCRKLSSDNGWLLSFFNFSSRNTFMCPYRAPPRSRIFHPLPMLFGQRL